MYFTPLRVSDIHAGMRYWVFDLDGTLVDSFELFFVLLADIFEKQGAVFKDEYRIPALTESLPVFFEKHLGKDSVPEAMSILHLRSNEDAVRIRPFEGVIDTLRALHQRGERIAVWTNRDLVSAQLIIQHSGLSPYVEICVSGNCTVQRKPYTDGLAKIMSHFGCDSESITMVGDHEHDVTAAKSIGVRAVRASWHCYWPMDKCTIADFQFHRFEHFDRWINELE